MLALLGQVPGADIEKLSTFDASTETMSVKDLPVRPDFCFIDGEHTDEAVLRDARFCADAVDGQGVIAFHDYDTVGSAIRAFLHEAWQDITMAIAFPGLVFALELGGLGVLQSPLIDRFASRSRMATWRTTSRSRRSANPFLAAWSAMTWLDASKHEAKQHLRMRSGPRAGLGDRRRA
jgi:hypothetical protein